MEKKDPIEEARRYVANAEEVIKKANYDPELNIYTDGKYVKMAGNLASVKGKAARQSKNTRKPPGNAIVNFWRPLWQVTTPCICTWATMAQRTKRLVTLVSNMPTLS